MNIALINLYDDNYQSMADLTTPIKTAYCEKHGYKFFEKINGFIPNITVGYQKCFWLADLMLEHPEIEWFLHLGTDCLITNHSIKLESFIDNDYHFMVTKDDTGINGENFFIRNTPEGREYIENLKQIHPVWNTEEGNMRDDEKNPKWNKITKYLSQSTINSYDHQWYPHKKSTDQLGGKLGWEKGSFVLHAITGLLPGRAANEPFVYEWKMNILRSRLDEIIWE